jgi:hypothetical protein
MNERLRHIFDYSTCLNRRQMRQYVAAQMSSEERHAAEVHLNTCQFCSEALDGLMASNGVSVKLMEDLNASFIKEHLELTVPHVHVNSIAAAPIQKTSASQHKTIQSNKRIIILVGGVLSAFAVMWYIEFLKDANRHKTHIEPAIYQSAATAPPTVAPKKTAPKPVKQPVSNVAATVKYSTTDNKTKKEEKEKAVAVTHAKEVKKESIVTKKVAEPKKVIAPAITKSTPKATPAKVTTIATKPVVPAKSIVPAAATNTAKPPASTQPAAPAAPAIVTKPAVIGPPPMDTNMH